MLLKCIQYAERGIEDESYKYTGILGFKEAMAFELSLVDEVILHMLEKDFHLELCAKAKGRLLEGVRNVLDHDV